MIIFEKGYKVVQQSPGNNWIIQHTLDGSEPHFSSSVYKGPIVIRKNTTLAAALYRNDQRDGRIQ
jgi:hypothetical protein